MMSRVDGVNYDILCVIKAYRVNDVDAQGGGGSTSGLPMQLHCGQDLVAAIKTTNIQR